LTVPNLEAGKLHPLETADTSSPQTTLKSFQNVFIGARPILDKISTTGFSPETVSALKDKRNRAIHCFDLSKVGKRLRDDMGPEAVILLAEILARIELPPFEAVPDARAMKSEGVTLWKIPHTGITIGQVQKGPRKGEYLFTPETVHPAKLWKAKAFDEKVNFQLMREFEKEGIKFAFPTTTTYLVQEDGRPLYFTPVKDSPE